MIRYKEKVLEQYSICPATGDIFDANTGEVQKTYLCQGRFRFKSMLVHCIMAHTFYGYNPGLVVHHLDENPLNNKLSNLIYISDSEHKRIHWTNKNPAKNMSEEIKAKLSAAHKGKPSPRKGATLSKETKAKLSAAKKGKHLSEEQKQKLSAALKGRKFSEEAKAKIREKALLREAKKRASNAGS